MTRLAFHLRPMRPSPAAPVPNFCEAAALLQRGVWETVARDALERRYARARGSLYAHLLDAPVIVGRVGSQCDAVDLRDADGRIWRAIAVHGAGGVRGYVGGTTRPASAAAAEQRMRLWIERRCASEGHLFVHVIMAWWGSTHARLRAPIEVLGFYPAMGRT